MYFSSLADNCSADCSVACVGHNDCPACNEGFVGNDCTSCAAGYALVGAGPICEACFIGSWSDVNSTSCTFCEAGTFSTEAFATSSDACQSCPIGYYTLIPGLSNCSVCDTGYTTLAVGSSSCVPVTSSSTGGNSASTVGAAVGASVGFLALLILMLLAVLFVRRRRQNEKAFDRPASFDQPASVILKSQHPLDQAPISSNVDDEFAFIANMVRRASTASASGPIRYSMFETPPSGNDAERRPSYMSENGDQVARRSTAWLHNPEFWV